MAKKVYHETELGNKEEIMRDGLLPKPERGYSDEYILQEGVYEVRKDISEFFGAKIVNTILEKFKPKQYPLRKNCIFFHTSKDNIGNTKLTLSVKYKHLNYPAYQVPYDIAKEVFTKSMSRISKNKKIKESFIRKKAKKYWSNVEIVKNKESIEPRQEMFVTESINPEYLNIYYEWGE